MEVKVVIMAFAEAKADLESLFIKHAPEKNGIKTCGYMCP